MIEPSLLNMVALVIGYLWIYGIAGLIIFLFLVKLLDITFGNPRK